MTIETPGAARCELCKRKAVHHRLSDAGGLFCLELAHHAHVRWFHAVEINPTLIYRLPVHQLRAGSFPDGTGARLRAGTRT